MPLLAYNNIKSAMKWREKMENLYAIVINGTTYFLKGIIPQSSYNEVEKIVNSITISESDANCSLYLEQITEKLKIKLQVNVTPINVKYVFRKRK